MTYMVRDGEVVRVQGKDKNSTIVQGVSGWSAAPLMRHMYADPDLQPGHMNAGLLPSIFDTVVFVTGSSAMEGNSPWWSNVGRIWHEPLHVHGTQRRLAGSLSHLWSSSAVTSAGNEANFTAVARVLGLLASGQPGADTEDNQTLEEFSLFSLDVDPAASQEWTVRRYWVSKQPTVGTPAFNGDDFDV